MEKRRDVIPAGSSLTAEEDAWFEGLAIREFDRLPTSAWDNALMFWRWLPHAHPSTRRRLLEYLLLKCTARRDAFPVKLAVWIGRELNASPSPRARVHDPAKMRAAARFYARNPKASLAEIAVAAGVPRKNKTTVRGFKERPEFKKSLLDEQILFKLEQARTALASGDEEDARALRDETDIYSSED